MEKDQESEKHNPAQYVNILKDKCGFCRAHFALAVINDEGNFIRANRAMADLYGVSEQELLKNGPLDYSPARQPDGQSSREKARALIIEALKKNSSEFEWRHIRQGNPDDQIDCLVRLSNISDQRGPRFLAYVHDVTSQKKQSRDREKKLRDQFAVEELKILERVVGGLSHDINNVSTVILGNLHFVLAQEGLSAEANSQEISVAASTCLGIGRRRFFYLTKMIGPWYCLSRYLIFTN